MHVMLNKILPKTYFPYKVLATKGAPHNLTGTKDISMAVGKILSHVDAVLQKVNQLPWHGLLSQEGIIKGQPYIAKHRVTISPVSPPFSIREDPQPFLLAFQT